MEKKFRSSLFGGFNRHDVLDFIREWAENDNALREENDSLRAQITDLRQQLLHAAQQREYLRMTISQLEEKTEMLENECQKQAEEYRALLQSASGSLQETLTCLKSIQNTDNQEEIT